MKKILTLLFALGTITTVFAQYHRRGESREIILGQDRHIYNSERRYDAYSFGIRERDDQIRRINWRFDNEIAAVAHDRYLRGGERRRQIRMLEEQRRDEIRMVNLRFSQRAPYDNRVYRDGRY